LKILKKLYKPLHAKYSLSRRVQVISKEISKLVPDGSTVLDIGGGGGEIAKQLSILLPNLKIKCIDIDVRENSEIEVVKYDGLNIPFENETFDFSIIVDVLHHSKQPFSILKEALRVTKVGLIVKDHNCNSFIQKKIMTVTDTLGNWHHDVPLVFNFLSRKCWLKLWQDLKLEEKSYETKLNIYTPFRGCIFASDMDFISLLKK
jgi:ubiquinone/menaquinone biosynthesis C-methylase UbiE